MSIYTELKEAGVLLDYHESDLYAKKCPESIAIIEKYEFKNNVRLFWDSINKEPWYDIPFAFDPFWERRIK